jgi:AcrR family transcriptional regulator
MRIDTRAAVVAATTDAITANGVDGVRLVDIAATAGVSVGAIQHHFSSKDELIDTAFAEHEAQTLAAIRGARANGSDADAWGHLQSALRSYRLWDDTHRRSRMWIALAASAMTRPRHAELVRRIEREWERVLGERIEAGVRDGTFSPLLPVEQVVDVLVRLTDGYALVQVASPDDPLWRNPDRVAGRFIRLAAALLGVDRPTLPTASPLGSVAPADEVGDHGGVG